MARGCLTLSLIPLLLHFLIATELFGSREEVFATLSEMLVADCEFTEKQRREIFEEIKRLHGETDS